jgi:hypothetical protein
MSGMARIVILVTMAFTVLGPFVALLILNIGINPRYASAGAPAFVVLLAAGSGRAFSKGLVTWSRVALLATMSLGLGLHLAHPGHGREDMNAAARWLQANVGERETILVTSDEMVELTTFHWPRQRYQLYPPSRITVDRNNAEALAREFPFVGRSRTIYVVGRWWESDPDRLLQETLAKRYTTCPGTEVRGIRILCFVDPPGSGEDEGESGDSAVPDEDRRPPANRRYDEQTAGFR